MRSFVLERSPTTKAVSTVPRKMKLPGNSNCLLSSSPQDFTHGPRALPLTEEQSLSLARVQEGLRAGWTVHMTPDGRFYYCK